MYEVILFGCFSHNDVFFPFRLIFAHSFASFGVLRANVIVEHDYFNGYVNGIILMGLTVRNTIEAYQYKAFN